VSPLSSHYAPDNGAFIITRLLPLITAYTHASDIPHNTMLQCIDGTCLRMVYKVLEGLH
jgi:hypothetical protein